jgi:hypothetical protein
MQVERHCMAELIALGMVKAAEMHFELSAAKSPHKGMQFTD